MADIRMKVEFVGEHWQLVALAAEVVQHSAILETEQTHGQLQKVAALGRDLAQAVRAQFRVTPEPKSFSYQHEDPAPCKPDGP